MNIYRCGIILLFITPVWAGSGYQSGRVDELVMTIPTILTDADYVSLNNLDASASDMSGSNCSQFHGGYVFRIKDGVQGDALVSQLLLAKQGGYQVQIIVDDSDADTGGFCYIRQLVTDPELFHYR